MPGVSVEMEDLLYLGIIEIIDIVTQLPGRGVFHAIGSLSTFHENIVAMTYGNQSWSKLGNSKHISEGLFWTHFLKKMIMGSCVNLCGIMLPYGSINMVNIGSGNRLSLNGTKSLTKAILTYYQRCYVAFAGDNNSQFYNYPVTCSEITFLKLFPHFRG